MASMAYSTKKDRSPQFKNECKHPERNMNEKIIYLPKEIDKSNPSYR